jgi:hypothetical protein
LFKHLTYLSFFIYLHLSYTCLIISIISSHQT